MSANAIDHRGNRDSDHRKATQIKFRLILHALSGLSLPNQPKKYRAAIEKKSFSLSCPVPHSISFNLHQSFSHFTVKSRFSVSFLMSQSPDPKFIHLLFPITQ
jgi:hypothetical protein